MYQYITPNKMSLQLTNDSKSINKKLILNDQINTSNNNNIIMDLDTQVIPQNKKVPIKVKAKAKAKAKAKLVVSLEPEQDATIQDATIKDIPTNIEIKNTD